MFSFAAVEITVNSYAKNNTKILIIDLSMVHHCILTCFMAVVQSPPHFPGSQTCASPW